MHTVVELKPVTRAADRLGLSGTERSNITSSSAADPMIGDVIQGTGGYRKVRFAGCGKGKSGGYRVVTSFRDRISQPVWLRSTRKATKPTSVKQRGKPCWKLVVGTSPSTNGGGNEQSCI